MEADNVDSAAGDTGRAGHNRSKGWQKLLALVFLISISFLVWPIAAHVYLSKRFFRSYVHVHDSILALETRCPPSVDEDQWERAVDWTANLICQDFFAPNWEELEGLEKLSKELDERSAGDVDLETLQWIWDQCETTCGGPNSNAMRFKDLRLLHNGPITDENLRDVWSINRCVRVDLDNTEISDDSIPFLSTLHQLNLIGLEGTKITEVGVAQLQQALPECEVSW